MSAYHGEVRRRQAALERLRARTIPEKASKHGTDTGATQALPPATEPRPTRCYCPCQHTSTTSAKLPNRFSALQYLQQW